MRETLALTQKMQAVTVLVADLDGAVGDGRRRGRFDRADLIGAELAITAGWRLILLTDGEAKAAEPLAAIAGVEIVTSGADRAEVLADLDPATVAWLGSDLPDVPAMWRCGLTVATRDGALLLRRKADLVLDSPAGRGALRELVERLLASVDREVEVVRAWFAARGIEDPGPWLPSDDEAEHVGAPKIGFRR
jgi:3-deoxy-D-manno-octulosonate 8-phosphate phosphatase (KDO 8-P phosphatase)